MRISILFTTITLVLLSLAGSNDSPAITTAGLVSPMPSALKSTADPKTVRFTSRYVNLLNCPSGMTKKEEKEAEERGQDIGSVCNGPGRWRIVVGYSACSSAFTVERGGDSISLGMQAVNFKQRNVEFRLANGSAFAVIMRHYEYAGNDQCPTAGKITKETLQVKGLRYFEHIDGEVNAREPNANAKARAMADVGYAGNPTSMTH